MGHFRLPIPRGSATIRRAETRASPYSRPSFLIKSCFLAHSISSRGRRDIGVRATDSISPPTQRAHTILAPNGNPWRLHHNARKCSCFAIVLSSSPLLFSPPSSLLPVLSVVPFLVIVTTCRVCGASNVCVEFLRAQLFSTPAANA